MQTLCHFQAGAEGKLPGDRLHCQRIAQGQFGDSSSEIAELYWMIWMAEQDITLLPNNQNGGLGGVQVLFCDGLDIVERYGLDPTAIFLPEIRFFGIAASEFILGESVGDLRFG